MIHVPNERHKQFPKYVVTKAASAEYKASRDGTPSHVRLVVPFSELPSRFFSSCPFAYIVVRPRDLLKQTDVDVPASEIISARMEFTTQEFPQKHASGERKNIFEIAIIDSSKRSSDMQEPLKPAHKYELDMPIYSQRILIGIRAPLRYSISRFNVMMRNTKVYVYMQLRRLNRIEISADYLFFRAVARPENIWMRYYLIKESNVAMQRFIENAKTDDELLSKVTDGTLYAYYDAHTAPLSYAVESIMSVVYAPRGFNFENSIVPKETLTEKYVYYTQTEGSLPKKCDAKGSAVSPYVGEKLEGQLRVMRYIGAGHYMNITNTGEDPYDRAKKCPVAYFCDSAFPFSQFVFQQSLVFIKGTAPL